MQDLMSAAGSVGFPMAVTAYLLVRIEAKLGALNDSIQSLAHIIAQQGK